MNNTEEKKQLTDSVSVSGEDLSGMDWDGLSASLLVHDEYREAKKNFPDFNSAHEGFAVLKEEVDELWDQVKVNQKNRDIEKMKKEAIQVAAMALRFIVDVCNEEKGRK